MNKYPSPIIITVFALCCITAGILIAYFGEKYDNRTEISSSSVPVPAAQAGPGHTFEDLLDAIEWVESKGDANAKGDWVQWVNKEAGLFEGEYRAVGAYQIHKIYVDDVNRIMPTCTGDERTATIIWTPVLVNGEAIYSFDYIDRLDRYKSRAMTYIYLQHYGGTFEEMARKHNGGPQGHKKESTKAYWIKVQARLMTKEIK